MWATNITLRFGPWLVGFRPDGDRTATMLHSLFGAYVESSRDADESNFSVRRPGSRLRPHPGDLYIGGHLAARCDTLSELAHALVGYTSGVADERQGLITTMSRVFARDGRAVLVDAVRPTLVDDGLLPAEIVELPLWEPRVDTAAGAVVPPANLPHLEWDAAQIPEPDPGPESYPIVGIVTKRSGVDSGGLRELWGTASGELDDWRDLLGDLYASGHTRTALTPAEYGRAVEELLAPPS